LVDTITNMQKKIVKLLISAVILFVTGCATTTPPSDPKDPFENFNRHVFTFNMTFDKVILCPAAKAYNFILPKIVRKGISNFFFNFAETSTIINDLLQFSFKQAGQDTARLAINSTIGLLGLIDIASQAGIKRHYNDLGLTFAKWGSKDSPYIMIPILGPTTIANGVGLIVDYYYFTPFTYLKPDVRIPLLALLFVDIRDKLLPADKLMAQAFDQYVFVRDAYFQRRARLQQENMPGAADKDTYVEEDIR